MKRRNFIERSALATLTIGSLLNGCDTAKHSTSEKTAPSTNPEDNFPLHEMTVNQLQQKFVSGELTSEQVTRLYLQRIESIDKNGPALRSVIEINPDALSIAQAMDAERKQGRIRGPLHGVPVLIKDNIDTADRMQTTAGSLAMIGNIAKKDAFIVAKLRQAGAVLLGKTNLSEWANFRSTKSCSGWSSRGGQTKNPYIIDHNPCGSSSGSGVAVSANLCMLAIGTETDGSVTCPAAVNGIVGLKPTVGLLSRTGIIPISHTQDTAGPMARTVRDVAVLLQALVGNDPSDASMNNLPARPVDYLQFLQSNALQGKRIGIEKKLPGNNHLLHALQKKNLELLKAQGATVVEVEYLDKINETGNAEFDVLQFEFKHGLNKYLSAANAPVKTLADVIAFNKNNEDLAMPFFKQELLESSQAKGDLSSTEYKTALEKSFTGSKKIIDLVLKENQLDALCGLTMGPACSIDNIYGDRWGDVFLTQPAATSGYPHITIPAGKVYDLPVGFSFFGPPFTEATLLGMAHAFEQAGKQRVAPTFKKAFL